MEHRGYVINNNAGYSLTNVTQPGSGKVPKALMGWYTSPKEAKLGIDLYLNSLKKGTKPNAKKNSDSAD